MKKLKWLSIFLILPIVLLLFPQVALTAKAPTIDKSNLAKGIIAVKYDEGQKASYMMRISKGMVSDDYQVATAVNYPLTAGNGKYKVTIGELVEGKKYKVIAAEEVNLDLKDDKVVFLQSTQMINWNDKTKAVVKAKELVKNAKNDEEKIGAIYRYIVNNFIYDNEKAKVVKTRYVPDLDATYDAATGICYDYATMMAAMLRSVGIPAKLVMGYHKDDIATYHAWNKVYLDGKWVTIDTTYDAPVIQAGYMTPMLKLDANYTNVHKTY